MRHEYVARTSYGKFSLWATSLGNAYAEAYTRLCDGETLEYVTEVTPADEISV
jgi:hypothetical protein